jgi:hypothetical protein
MQSQRRDAIRINGVPVTVELAKRGRVARLTVPGGYHSDANASL